MHKLAIAALVTASVGGAGAIVVTATRSDAHAQSHSAATAAAARQAVAGANPTASAPDQKHGALCDLMETLQRHTTSTAAPAAGGGSTTALAKDGTDCAAVGRHLAELEGDTTHGPNNRPDEETCAKCAAHYTSACESEGWSLERRSCTLAAGDLINAHLCAGGGAATSDHKPAAIPPHLACSVLGPQVTTIVQAAGMHTDVGDMSDQVSAACELGDWPIALRECFAAATTVDTLKLCIVPAK